MTSKLGVVLVMLALAAGCAVAPPGPVQPGPPQLPPGPGQVNAYGEACHTSTFSIMVPTVPGTAPSLVWPDDVPPRVAVGRMQVDTTHRTVRRGCRPTFTAGGQEAQVLIVFEEARDEHGQSTNVTPFENMRGEPVWVFTARDAQRLRGREGTVCSKYPGCKYSVIYTGGDGRHPPLDPWIIIN